MAQHTPGPWKLSLPDETAVASFDGAEIAAVQGDYDDDDVWPVMAANARLIAAAPEMIECLDEGRRAIGDHNAQADCYATGPLTGDPFRDLVQCPACSFISMYDAVKAKIAGAAIAKAEGR
jgi:hypothetical protein